MESTRLNTLQKSVNHYILDRKKGDPDGIPFLFSPMNISL